MNDNIKPNAVFWIAGVIFLLWNLMGCGMYLFDALASDAQYSEAYGQEMTALRDAYPAWAMGGYAIGVWGGLLAAIMILVRKKIAALLFVISLLGALISNFWTVTSPVVKEAGGSGYWIMPVVITVIGLIEIWFSRKKAAQSVLS